MLKGETKFGKTVLLRPLKLEESELYRKWFNDPEVKQWMVGPPRGPISEEEEREIVKELIASRNDRAFVIEVEGKLIGTCGLNQIDWKLWTARVGVTIGEKEYWNKGIGTTVARLLINYGFNQLGLKRILGSALEFNKRTRGAARKVGYREGGRNPKALRRKVIFEDGHIEDRYWDVIHSTLRREEWAKNR